jgi:hypothetical protein
MDSEVRKAMTSLVILDVTLCCVGLQEDARILEGRTISISRAEVHFSVEIIKSYKFLNNRILKLLH